MTWESIVLGALQGVSSFVNSITSVIGGAINPAAVEGILALFALSIIYRLFQGDIKLPKIKIPKLKHTKEDDDDDEYEYIRVRRRRK